MAKKTLQRITVNEQLLNRYTRHSVFLQQLEKGEALRIGRFMKQNVFPSIYQKLIAELNKVKDIKTIGSVRRIKRLNQMLASVKQTAIAGFVRAEKQAISRLVDVSRFEAQWNVNTIERTVPLDISMVMPSNAVLRTLVTTRAFGGPDNQHKLDTWFKGLSTSVRNNVNKQLRVGIAAGESVPALGKRVQKAFSTGTKQAQAIARTATSAVVHNAREEVFKANKAIVPKVQYQATLDDRTTVVCINLDGKIFETGTGPRPPVHFQCRSTVVPVTPSWQEFGVSDPPPATRASMNGAVPAKINYREWLKQQPKSTQIKVLGKKKAELYRSGRIRIEKFSSRDLKPLTLKQISRREGVSISPAPPTTVAPSVFRPAGTLADANKFAALRGNSVLPTNVAQAVDTQASGAAFRFGPWSANKAISESEFRSNWRRVFMSRKDFQGVNYASPGNALSSIKPDKLLIVQNAVNYNGENRVFRRVMQRHSGGKQQVIFRRAPKGHTVAGEQIGGTTHIVDSPFLDPGKYNANDLVPAPGMATSSSSGGLAATLRHEYGHTLYDRTSSTFKHQWTTAMNGHTADEIKTGITSFASSNPNEAFSELFSIRTSTKWDATVFPEWVSDVTKLIEKEFGI